MKKVLVLVAILCLCTTAYAEKGGKKKKPVIINNNVTNVTNVTNVEAGDDGLSMTGVKMDAPNLVKIDDKGDWSLGAEGGKVLMRGIFGDERDWVEADKGYFAFIKLTYSGCLVNCNKGE